MDNSKKIIDILPENEQRRERALHIIKEIAQARKKLDAALDNLVMEVLNEKKSLVP